jgi:Tol biopolymer transport system component
LDQGGFFLFPARDETVAFQRVFAEPQQIKSRNLQNGEQKVLYKLEAEAFGGGWMLSPDAKYLAFGTCRGEGSGWMNMVKCVPASGGETRELLSSTNGCSGIAWFPDSRRILVRCGKELWVLSIDGQAPRKLKVAIDVAEPSIHPSGQQIAFQTKTTRSELWLMENAAPAQGKPIAATRR